MQTRNAYGNFIWKSLKKYESHAKASNKLKYSHYVKLKNIFLGSVSLKIVLKTFILPGDIDLKAPRIRIGMFNPIPRQPTFLLDTQRLQ